MAHKRQESRERDECRYEPHHESIVCAVMFAIVTSILGSAMFSLVQGTDKKVIKQEVYKSSINCNCHESAHSHFVQRIVQCEKQETPYPAFLRALSLFLFCAGYFGDEWRNVTQDRADRNCEIDVKRTHQDFPLEFLGWLFFTLQACLVNNLVLYASLGIGAICCVSLDLEKKKSRNVDGCENQCDWLCENAIWMTWLLLSIALPFRAVILAGALLIVALLIFITKVSGWTEGRQYGRRALAALTIGFPLLLIITDCSFH